MKIKSKKIIKLDSIVKVYDLESPLNNNFALANGLIVHNSKDLTDSIAGALWSCKNNIHKSGTMVTTKELERTIDFLHGVNTRRNKAENFLENLVRR